ncbi:histidine kinase [Actinoallomurus iriomotensis]|uniref:histidine kinase n=1 Tax=Actinoallomurus iriomotensis TaxID=478107 RepID=A0A9W6S4X4_9ACTN|nr:histidine kinase [Actinoallomurus iriomotensis]
MDRAVLVLLVALIATGGGCFAATAAAQPAYRTAVVTFTGPAAIAVCVAVAVAAYFLYHARALRGRIQMMGADVTRLADETLPAMVQRLREGASADTALAEIAHPADGAPRRLLRTAAQEIGRGERMRDAAMAACANAAGRVQALATSMLADLREMEDRYGEDVLGDLLKLDHSTAQAGRLADSIAVLTGARSGRRWTKPIVMESILRGAVGRISAYQRVRVHSTSTVAVAGYAAEGVMHALAELMDNATSFSPPSDQVHVYVEEVHAGVIVTIEDAGLAMTPAALERAKRAVSFEPLDLTTLSGTRLGLAVVGCLARKHGLTVSFRPSSRGGTGAVVLIPQQLTTRVSREVTTGTRPAVTVRGTGRHRTTVSRPVRESAPVKATPVKAESSGQDTGSGPDGTPSLPRRRRGQTLSQSTSAKRTAPKPATTRQVADAGARFSAFRQATRGKTASSSPDSTDSTDSPDRTDDRGSH